MGHYLSEMQSDETADQKSRREKYWKARKELEGKNPAEFTVLELREVNKLLDDAMSHRNHFESDNSYGPTQTRAIEKILKRLKDKTDW